MYHCVKQIVPTTRPYIVEYLNYDFLKSFSKILFCKTIRPGIKKGDPVVTNIKALMYEPNKTISYKLRFTEPNWSRYYSIIKIF